MPKLLIHSNAPWAATGYGQQVGIFAPRFSRYYDTSISAFYGLEGSPLQLNEDITVYPGVSGKYGNEQIRAHALHHFGGDLRDGLVMSLMDVWVLDPEIWREMNVCCWCPVDHDPAPPLVRQFFQGSDAIPIAMSRFGQDRLAEFDPLYVPHGIDTAVYRPKGRGESRKLCGFPQDAFVVGVVAANKGNPSRKCFPEILESFAALRQEHDNAVLYLHTERDGIHDGVSLRPLIRTLGIPDDAVILTDQYRYRFSPFSPDMMATLYSAMDVLLNPSKGEGFGIPVLEAQACGTPAIVTDFSAMSELCASGWKVSYTPEWSTQLSWQARPNVTDIIDSLEHCYRLSESEWTRLHDDAREHALMYDADRVMEEHFLPALAEVQRRLDARAPKTLKAAA